MQCVNPEQHAALYSNSYQPHADDYDATCDSACEFSAIFESHFPASLLGWAEGVQPFGTHGAPFHREYSCKGTVKTILPHSSTIPALCESDSSTSHLAIKTACSNANLRPEDTLENSRHTFGSVSKRKDVEFNYGTPPLVEPLNKRAMLSTANIFFQRRSSRDGLDNLTRRVVETLQRHGKATFEELHKLTGIETRRLYDITNILAATPFISKPGRKRERTPFIFGDGAAVDEPVAIEHILLDIELEQTKILMLLEAFNERARTGGQFVFTC